MDFRQLKHFVAIVGTGNYSKAGELVHLTQPALTRSIQNLEQEVGVPLLLRQSTGVVPTEAGKVLLERANRLLNDWVHTKADIRALKDKSEGHINVGIVPLFAHSMMRQVLIDFRFKHPTATISVIEGSFVELRSYLLEGNCDVLLTHFPEDHSRDSTYGSLEIKSLLTIQTGILASATHPLAKKGNPTKEDLATSAWALFSRSSEEVNTYLAQSNISLRSPAAINTNSLSLLISLLKSGEYLTSLAPIMLIDQIVSGEVVLLPKSKLRIHSNAGLVLCKERENRPLVDSFCKSAAKFCDEIRDVLGSSSLIEPNSP